MVDETSSQLTRMKTVSRGKMHGIVPPQHLRPLIALLLLSSEAAPVVAGPDQLLFHITTAQGDQISTTELLRFGCCNLDVR